MFGKYNKQLVIIGENIVNNAKHREISLVKALIVSVKWKPINGFGAHCNIVEI